MASSPDASRWTGCPQGFSGTLSRWLQTGNARGSRGVNFRVNSAIFWLNLQRGLPVSVSAPDGIERSLPGRGAKPPRPQDDMRTQASRKLPQFLEIRAVRALGGMEGS